MAEPAYLLEAAAGPRYLAGKPNYEAACRTPEELVAWTQRMGRPVEIEIIRGRQAGDLVLAFYCLVAGPRLMLILRNLGATGYDVFPVRLARPSKGKALDYTGLCVTGRARVDAQRTERFWQLAGQAPPDGDMFSVRGLFVDEGTRADQDLFRVENLGYNVFVSVRVAEVLEQARLKNVRLLPTRDVMLFHNPPGLWTPLRATHDGASA